ncbi:glycosyl hydrolase family 28-related protein [Halovenus sp. HT40]|uniref:glycosyl hydrolase family 28-related protein n=1 Tax=Halovenus sp. HT40 TaxID=3126691 RepID=UPI00300F0036
MSDETPRLDLGIFEQGDPQWDHTDTVEAVDEYAIERGSLDERPDRGEHDDELFHVIEQGITWRWDEKADDWVHFSGTGSETQQVPGTSSFETAQFDHAHSKKTPVWNVEAHGIEGDGEHEVGQAVHELLGTVAEAGGGIVYFPPGRYRFERTPLIGDSTIIEGAGHSTVFEGVRPDGPTGRALLSNRGFDSPGYEGASNWAVRNLRIDSPESNGIMPAHAENVRFENIHGDRIYYHHLDIVSSRHVTIDGFRATQGGRDDDADAPVQFDNQIPGTDANGIWDGDASTYATADGTPVQNCTLTDFEIAPENGPEYGVRIHREGAESITITEGRITGCQHSAIRADTGEEVTDLTVDGVSCLENARGISLGEIESGRHGLTIDNVTIRTEDSSLAGGSGLYASGFDEAEISNILVEGQFENSILFDDMADLKLSTVTARGASSQALRFRTNADATLTTARAADCGDAGLYVGPDSSLAYGGVSFENVGEEVTVDGELREWRRS